MSTIMITQTGKIIKPFINKDYSKRRAVRNLCQLTCLISNRAVNLEKELKDKQLEIITELNKLIRSHL